MNLPIAGPLADELTVERSLPSCPSQLSSLAPSPLGRPQQQQQQKQQLDGEAATEAAAAATSGPASTADGEQLQQSVEQQVEPPKAKRRWGFKSLALLRRRTAH